jgi:tRNA(Ile)-lysidine synthetase-like protein
MQVDLEPGKYVLAVSGGVDSMVLLDLLAGRPDLALTVAHFDHGIRMDSKFDAIFVRLACTRYGLPFVTERAELGPDASEATARTARYDFLRRTLQEAGAAAIVTAHHQGDRVETAVINWQRGTGRRGLTALKDRPDIKRPLLAYSKAQLLKYAEKNNISWREDSTNHLPQYARNRVRQKLSGQDISGLAAALDALQKTNDTIDQLIEEQLNTHLLKQGLERKWYKELPTDVATEIMAAWLRKSDLADFDRLTLERLTQAAQTAATGKKFDIRRGAFLAIQKDFLAIEK